MSINNNYDEKKLVSRLIDNDEEAYCILYALYKKRIIRFAFSFLKSEELAEDVFQDTFIALWKRRAFLNPDASISSYLYTIARNRVLNILRDLKPEDKVHEEILSQAIDNSSDVSSKLEAKELENIIVEATKNLTPRQREVFEMSRNEGMSHKKISEKLGISVYTVQEHISLSLKVLRQAIKENYKA